MGKGQMAEAGGFWVWGQPAQRHWDSISKIKHIQNVWKFDSIGRALTYHVWGHGLNFQYH
jgi:hypothetical protein